MLNGLIPHYIDGDFKGHIYVDGKDSLKSSVGELASKVGYVYQDFENQIVRPTVLDDASYACLNNAFKDYLKRGEKALEKCGLKGREDDYIWQLSGGQTHILALAGALALDPDVLILDEPIAQLDPSHADRIYELLKKLNMDYGKTIIVIEHHTQYIADYCKHVLLLSEGNFKWKLKTKEALKRIDELAAANIFVPQVTQAGDLYQKNGYHQDEGLPIDLKEATHFFRDLHYVKRRETSKQNKRCQNLIEFKSVSLAYHSIKGEDRQVFKDLDLKIKEGDHIALIGTNGAGKSSLMKMMVNLLKNYQGAILFKGEDIKKTRTSDLGRKISLVYQNPEQMFIKDSIENDISFALRARNLDYEKRTQELLERFDLVALRKRDGRLLSGGQMRRASLAIGIALDPEILLLDEPTANLDMATRKDIMHTLKQMDDVIKSAIIATHDMQLVAEWANRIIVLHEGRIVGDGDREAIFGSAKILDEVKIRPPQIFELGQRLEKSALIYTVEEFMESFKQHV